MRFTLWILLGSFLVLPAAAYSQSWSNITQAINSGDAASLSRFFSENLEVALLDREDSYSRDEAGKMIADFFSTHQVKGFSQVHRGASRGNDAQYCIGNLVTSKGTFRVYIYVSEDNGTLNIQELRFDQE